MSDHPEELEDDYEAYLKWYRDKATQHNEQPKNDTKVAYITIVILLIILALFQVFS